MSFFSTRGGACVTASQAILTGLASDGGLYVPAMFPPFSESRLSSLVNMDYRERASAVLRKYLEDFSISEIDAAVNAAYTAEKFSDPEIAPLRQLGESTYVMELFHGPTLAFKDMALQLLPHLVTLSAKKNGETREISILAATSGDTGKAALEGFRDVRGTSCTVFYPLDGVSPVQQLQMVTTGGQNTHVIGVDGNFDDTQTGVKEIFASAEMAEKLNAQGRVLSSANSINFGRLVPQIVYYFSAYADLLRSRRIVPGDVVDFAVPTGNFGDILAGFYARAMGLPVGRLLCASNRNNVLTDFFATGTYSTHRTFFKTVSPSMDILVSSNLERLLFEVADRDGELIRVWMNQLKESGSYSVGEQRLDWLKSIFWGECADDIQTAAEIRRVFDETHYLMDPHTAVASHALREYRKANGAHTVTVIVGTASPYKFAQTVLEAVAGKEAAEGLNAFECAKKLEGLSGVPVPPQVAALENAPVCHTARCEVRGMGDALLDALK